MKRSILFSTIFVLACLSSVQMLSLLSKRCKNRDEVSAPVAPKPAPTPKPATKDNVFKVKNEVWGVNMYDNIYRHNTVNLPGDWRLLSGRLTCISV